MPQRGETSSRAWRSALRAGLGAACPRGTVLWTRSGKGAPEQRLPGLDAPIGMAIALAILAGKTL